MKSLICWIIKNVKVQLKIEPSNLLEICIIYSTVSKYTKKLIQKRWVDLF